MISLIVLGGSFTLEKKREIVKAQGRKNAVCSGQFVSRNHNHFWSERERGTFWAKSCHANLKMIHFHFWGPSQLRMNGISPLPFKINFEAFYLAFFGKKKQSNYSGFFHPLSHANSIPESDSFLADKDLSRYQEEKQSNNSGASACL